MFENIIGQAGILATLREELAEAKFPRAALFFGPPYSGKLSMALEVARVLCCREGTALWSCECASCRQHKELAHPHALLLGSRYSDVEIAASSGTLLRTRKPAAHYLFLRAVRKLTRRFDADLWESDDAKIKAAQEKVARIEELLAELPPGSELPEERSLAQMLEKLVAACVQLSTAARIEAISIGQVRRLAAWSHGTAADSRKIAILENADRMQDSARNALLKLLEEPPAGVNLILLSTRRGAIIPTILSRLRPYPFEQRSAAEEQEVMAKIFRDETGARDSLRGFFLAWREINPEKLSILSRRFMDLVRHGAGSSVDIIAELGELFPDRRGQRERPLRETTASFLEELTFRLHELMREGQASLDVLEGWNVAVREALARLDTYNISPQTAVESMFYRMRSAQVPEGRA
jgi:DNA polymerase III delta prime subunit